MTRSQRYAVVAFAGLAVVSAAQAAEWTVMADMPGLGRHHPATFSIDGMGYVVTGTTTGAAQTDDFYRYDPVTNTWTVLPDFPGSDRSYAYARAYGDKGYLGFGSGVGIYRDLWEYDSNTEAWTMLSQCPGAPRNHPAFVITDNGKIFVGAGNGASNMRDWWEYDIATDVWTQKTSIPGAARHHPYHFNIGNDAYVCFGHGSSIYKDVYRWSQSTETWTRMADLPAVGRVAGTEFSYAGKGYILSGENESHQQFMKGQFWEYDPMDDSWTRLTDHPGSSRWAPGSFVIGDDVYLTGGLSTSRLEKDLIQFPMVGAVDVTVAAQTSDIVFGVYPNPIQGVQLQIHDPDAVFQVGSARLYDVSGREVATLNGDSRTLQIPRSVASGQYFVRFGTKDGERVTRPLTVLR